jgi:hypothetical protein
VWGKTGTLCYTFPLEAVELPTPVYVGSTPGAVRQKGQHPPTACGGLMMPVNADSHSGGSTHLEIPLFCNEIEPALQRDVASGAYRKREFERIYSLENAPRRSQVLDS